MLGASWAQRRTYSLRLARNLNPWRTTSRQIALSLPKLSIPEVVDHRFSFGFVLNAPRERARQNYSTAVSSVAQQALALLGESKIEEATTLLAQFLNGQDSEQLVLEVVEGFLTPHVIPLDSDTLFAWLESFPDATSASSDIFHRIFDRLMDHGSSNLIGRFGILCASKGYHDFVTVYVSPVISAQVSAPEFAEWQNRVFMAVAAFKGFHTQPGSVLEEGNQDYDSIGSCTIPTTSVLQMVEENLPDILPASHPSDQMVFEDQSDEYTEYTSSPEAAEITKPLSSRALEEMVRQSKYQDAYGLLKELEELNVSPTPSHIYLSAANESIASLDADIDEQVSSDLQQQYLTWINLIPPRHLVEDDYPISFQRLKSLLFRSPSPNLFLISQTALILASKGFGISVVRQATRILYSDPSSTFDAQFIKDLETADHLYWKRYIPHEVRKRTSKFQSQGRSTTIRSLASVGRFDLAIDLLPDPSADGIQLPEHTYGTLLRHIRISGPEAVSKYQATVIQRMGGDGINLEYEETSMPPENMHHNLPYSLQYLKAAFKSDRPPPHPMTILAFIEAYISSGRTHALTLLLNKAMSTGYLHTSAFLYAEMLYYYRHHQFDALLEVITEHFYLGAGLPRGRIRALRRARELTPERPLSTRFHYGQLLKPPTKLWPSSAHCNLVWQILALKAPDDEALQILYGKLRRTLKSGMEGAGAPDNDPVAKPSNSLMRNRLPTASAFIPFMRRLMWVEGPRKGAEVMGDMIQLGLKPGVAHLTEFAHRLATAGEKDSAIAILTKLEANLAKAREAGGGTGGTAHRVPFGSPRNRREPEMLPDVTLYVSLMRAFLDVGDTAAVELVAERLRKSGLGTTEEENMYLQEAYDDLEVLKTVHKRTSWGSDLDEPSRVFENR